MSMEFDMTFHGRSHSVTTDSVENFFRIGYDAYAGNHCEGSQAHYPSLWIPADSETPYMVLTEDNCVAVQTSLDGLGDLVEENTYHFDISWDSTELAVTITDLSNSRSWSDSWSRSATHDDFVGEKVPVYWMTNKFSIRQYNVGDATFSNIIITSEFATDAPTTAQPTNDPTRVPTTDPTSRPTNDPTVK